MQMKQELGRLFFVYIFRYLQSECVLSLLILSKQTQLNSLRTESVKVFKVSNVYHVEWRYNTMVSGVTLA